MTILDTHVPFSSAESWDNVGLLIGDETQEVNGILTTLDCTEAIVRQAIDKNINTIISHHPLIFNGVKSLPHDGYGKIIRLLIQHDINLIAMHTNLDVNPKGVNYMLADKLQLQNVRIINNNQQSYYKVQTYIPKEDVAQFKDKLSEAGIAQQGNYEYCFFESEGQGQFKPVENANPHIGEIGKIEYVDEIKVEFMIKDHQQELVEQLIHKHHPYETPVYDIMLMTQTSEYGLGVMGELPQSMTNEAFAKHAKQALAIPSVRYVGKSDATINKVAIVGGAGIGYEQAAMQQGADIFVTGDIKHHNALDAEVEGINLLDINHYSEYVMKEGLKHLLQQWLADEAPSLVIEGSDLNTDPFNYI